MWEIAEKTHLSLAFGLGFIVCVLLGLIAYGIYQVRKPNPSKALQKEFDLQVETARLRRSQAPAPLPPVNHERIVKVFKRQLEDTPSRRPVARISREDEPTGRFTRDSFESSVE